MNEKKEFPFRPHTQLFSFRICYSKNLFILLISIECQFLWYYYVPELFCFCWCVCARCARTRVFLRSWRVRVGSSAFFHTIKIRFCFVLFVNATDAHTQKVRAKRTSAHEGKRIYCLRNWSIFPTYYFLSDFFSRSRSHSPSFIRLAHTDTKDTLCFVLTHTEHAHKRTLQS